MDGGLLMPHFADPTHVWTFDDLQELPDDRGSRRLEIVDGTLVVSPPASLDHEYTIDAMRQLLREQLPPALFVAGPLAVDLEPSFRVPDLIIVPRALLGQGRSLFAPSEVSLAVEVVSPTSRTADRVTKPAEYAAAGIPAYWRVETESVELTAYAPQSGATPYVEQGRWGLGEVAELDTPFPVRVDIARLVPS